ncbi:hypothetical protein TRP8649_01371 [Pelagimonas phthalicica]|uniref:HTH cro/C1-type domain-containing protein n=2 Tax=Pelagimonas phthalicica TaxID=1037362 RepID=A0A238J9D5_9RHOB|nr:hypothetical protein CLV87_0701 [Pelagimonas phthalicica]SMX27268.1 hypothetical protein TRP8649_01371 [Pelagimonas phthalicica]
MAFKGYTAKKVADEGNIGVNTVGKFLRGDTHSMKHETLDIVCSVLSISNLAILDSENPLSETKDRLYAMVAEMSDDRAQRALELLEELE